MTATLMLDKAVPVAVEELSNVACPAPTESWRPYPHSEVVAALSDRLDARGITVRSSRLTLVDGAMYPAKGIKVEVKGARLFGSFDLEPTGVRGQHARCAGFYRDHAQPPPHGGRGGARTVTTPRTSRGRASSLTTSAGPGAYGYRAPAYFILKIYQACGRL